MGIYDDSRPLLSIPGISLGKLKYPAFVVVALVVLLAMFFYLYEALKPKPLLVSLAPNPLDLTEGQSSTFLSVRVFNTLNRTVSSVVVVVEEVGSRELIVFPNKRETGSMASGTDRLLKDFVIRPNPLREIKSGSYKIRVSLFFDGEAVAEEELILSIRAV